jgi:hypothetical protein
MVIHVVSSPSIHEVHSCSYNRCSDHFDLLNVSTSSLSDLLHCQAADLQPLHVDLYLSIVDLCSVSSSAIRLRRHLDGSARLQVVSLGYLNKIDSAPARRPRLPS